MVEDDPVESVLILHGLGRSHRSLLLADALLERAGYNPINLSYASKSMQIEELAERTITPVMDEHGDRGLHVLTHSMGGILWRAWCRKHLTDHDKQPHKGRCVMLGPPNHGSALVDLLERFHIGRLFLGPAGRQLAAHEDSLPNRLGPANFEVGVIAGTRSYNPLASLFIGKPSDGTVSVASTKLEGMKDHITLPVGHSMMMYSPVVISQAMRFFETGCFDHDLNFGEAVRHLAASKEQ